LQPDLPQRFRLKRPAQRAGRVDFLMVEAKGLYRTYPCSAPVSCNDKEKRKRLAPRAR